ncbi:aminoglycoside phosphotransferase family protein [Nonomuraea sediminis]|uniref:aminoglycoside phosphotransferase family protein n=1 Tax=Nonomuraea sediminis TaxID=2835864 RepID=UPI001BDC8C95|nr:aminoglycoside phosphotransferase family protein [Nonomuraea sediminis]
MNTVEDDLLAAARRQLGTVALVPNIGLPPHLRLLAAPDGQRYMLKRHSTSERFRAETRAYTTWVPQLGERAPHLISADPETLSLLLTVLPGRRATQLPEGSPAERHAHYAAGHTLRLLHQAPPGPHPSTDVAAYLAERMRWWAARAHLATLISTSELRTLHTWADTLATTALDSTICHLDYQPRNWILSSTGALAVLDFEHTRLDARIRDFARLEHRHWGRDPRLRAAFFDGYGHHPNPAEQELLKRFGALEAITALVRGHECGDPELLAHGRTLLTHLR